MVQECDTCSRRFFTPEVACIHCGSTDWQWAPSIGGGTVYSFTAVHRPPGPGFDVPFVLAAVDLDDGWTMMTNIVDCPADAVVIGMRVGVRFVAVSEEISLPCFAPA